MQLTFLRKEKATDFLGGFLGSENKRGADAKKSKTSSAAPAIRAAAAPSPRYT
jgi:hypothetical protein